MDQLTANNIAMLEVVQELVDMNNRISNLIELDPTIRPTMKKAILAAIEGNTKFVIKVTEHNLEIVDIVQNVVQKYTDI